jgi:3-oxoacyl-[acyl-carrier protein] reductase
MKDCSCTGRALLTFVSTCLRINDRQAGRLGQNTVAAVCDCTDGDIQVMDLMLENKVALITGPAKGMGAAITRAFAEQGCKLALLGRDTSAIEPVARDIVDGGGKAIVIGCDMTDAAQCDAAAKTAMNSFGQIDVLVNVAGGSGPIGKTGAETTPDEFDEIVTLNMNGCFHTIRAVLPGMIARRYGKIVNVGGTFGMRGRAGRLAYSASKWGLRGITKSFALEVGQHNVNVNCVAPGMVDGPRFRDKVCRDMAKKLGISEAEAAERHAADYALKRITVDSDVANACLFLASDVSRQITGVDLPVDGGWAAL